MNKVLYIRDCYFRLPENFDGTCGNALMLLALHRLEQEEQQAICKEGENRLTDFWNSDRKCTMAYCISDEEKVRNIEDGRIK